MSRDKQHKEDTLKQDGSTEEQVSKQEDKEGLGFETRDQLEAEVNKSEEEFNKLKDELLRVQAQMQNVQRRAEEDVSKARKYALEGFAKELLPVIDTFERALGEVPEEAHPVFEGVERTHDLFLKVFEKFDLKQLDPMGEDFDPAHHEAISTAPATKNEKDNSVVQVVQKGYLLSDRLIRPALVIVAKK